MPWRVSPSWTRTTPPRRRRHARCYRALANRPATLKAFSGMARTVYRADTTLTPKHAELAYLTATVTNDCFY